jgi:CDP-glucose 4,6-dehydratase
VAHPVSSLEGVGVNGGPDVTSSWNGRRVLVTGATGIVGSALTTRLLDAGAAVVTLIRDWDPQSELIRSGAVHRTSVVNGALEDYAAVERAINEHETDTVFHLGAQTIVGTALRNPLPTFEANIRGTYHLLEACRVHAGLVERIVVASSDKAYGEAVTLPYTEDTPLNGRHPYDVSKSCADLLALTYAHTYDLPVSVARCGNIYGPGDLNWSRIVPGTIRAALQGQPVVLRSDGLMTRDYVFVEDVVSAYLTLADHTPQRGVRGEGFNFSPGHPLTVHEVVSATLNAMGRPDLHPKTVGAARAEIQAQHLDSSRARARLGWTPSHTLGEGLQATVPWYRQLLRAAPQPSLAGTGA